MPIVDLSHQYSRDHVAHLHMYVEEDKMPKNKKSLYEKMRAKGAPPRVAKKIQAKRNARRGR